MGGPTNVKQSMLVTTMPATLDKGGALLDLARAERLMIKNDAVVSLECLAMDERCVAPTGRHITVKARHYVLAGGSINSPALLLRSDRSEEHTSELQSLMRISYAVFCLKKKKPQATLKHI